VAIAGAHGKIAIRLIGLLAAAGDHVIGLIRNPDHRSAVNDAGASAVICDLEHAEVDEVAAAIEGADAVVFAAGAGPGSGPERKLSMDRDGAIKLLAAAGSATVGRYVIVSSVGAESPPAGDDAFSVYLRAKADADAAIRASDRDWTIVRPGRLTQDPGSGRVRLDATPFRGQVSRDDVASVLAGVLHDRRASGRIMYVNGGEQPIGQALENFLSAS
jgi:nucleoside-diphosphate-sugar epimerase